MKRHLSTASLAFACALVAAALTAFSPAASYAQHSAEGSLWQNRHVTRHVKSYEGTRTCLRCHEDEAKDVFESIHYQWKAAAPHVVNARGKALGKINSTNDFCTNPSVSWISILTNDEGKVIGNGCSKCHAGLGLKPTAEMTPAQLENIDCLICHSSNYRREVVKKEDGSLAWRPTVAGDAQQMTAMGQNIGKPTNETCMRCHVGSGGGMNFKRGDIETAHAGATRDFDVHMGANMQCIQCHKFKAHKVKGAGTQMSGRDSAEPGPSCEGCHRGRIHAKADIEKHTRRVYCTACHIPSFAREDPTDMHRDWSRAEAVKGEGRFEPAITLASNVKPVYAWWNGKASVAMLDEPVSVGANGKVSLFKPEGSIKDAKSRIYAFKYHTARLPIDNATRMMIPVQVGPVFKTGRIEAGVQGGAKAWTGKGVSDVGWIETERYMGLFHEVQPKENALACNDCHQGGTRMDWKALGYPRDPAASRAARAK